MRRIAMLDFETLGLNISCPLLSVGVAVCDADNPAFDLTDFFSSNIDFDERGFNSLNAMETDTFMFWMLKASQEAREAAFKRVQASGQNIDQVFSKLCSFIITQELSEIWSKGADFDIAIFKYRCNQLGFAMPWNYKIQRCYRTMEAIHPDICKYEAGAVKHTALDDATDQLRNIHTVYQLTRGPASLTT